MVERGGHVQADQHQQHIFGENAVHVAGPAPARHSRAHQLRQFDPNMMIGKPRQDALIQPRIGTTNSSR